MRVLLVEVSFYFASKAEQKVHPPQLGQMPEDVALAASI